MTLDPERCAGLDCFTARVSYAPAYKDFTLRW